MGCLSRMYNTDNIIVSADRDAFQLIDDDGLIRVLIPSKGELIEYNRQKV